MNSRDKFITIILTESERDAIVDVLKRIVSGKAKFDNGLDLEAYYAMHGMK